MQTCIFCQIVKGESEAKFEYQDDLIVAFRDINPKAPVHILVVPKKHIVSVKTITQEDKRLLEEMIWVAKKIAAKKGLEGYKLVFNCGRPAGQLVDHLHLHLMGGWSRGDKEAVEGT